MPVDLAASVRAELEARLGPPAATAPRSVLGAGNDDLDAGRAYLRALAGTGLVVPAWPRELGGRAVSPEEAAVIRRELAAFGAPDLYPYLVGLELAGPTLLVHGTPEQRARWLPRIASGDEIWCQGFSEPDAGSDLASLAARAERDGDGWRVRGQKVWTSRGPYAQWCLLVARHDVTVPKHQGLTAFALDMRAPGVEVRPVRQMNGDTHFSELFLDAAIPDHDRIGAVGEGWRVALTTLSYERGAVAGGGSSSLLDVPALIALARARGRAGDPVVRAALARVCVESRVMALTSRRARDLAAGGRPGPEGSGMKLRGTKLFRAYAAVLDLVAGPDIAAHGNADADADADALAPWRMLVLTAPSLSIRGGTDEIQRNIVGERVLGLPPEPRADRDVPFDELPRR